MARGAVVVILSDGWERGDPGLVAREMQRLARLAYRIVWVNPRVAASGFSPRAGGMAAALPYCDALVSGHSLAALDEVVEAIAAERWRDAAPGTSWRRARAGSGGRGRGAVGQRHAGAGQLGGDAERLRARAAARRRRGGGRDERGGSEPPRSASTPGASARPCRRIRSAVPSRRFCDLEEHNALTAHQERQRTGPRGRLRPEAEQP